MSYNMNMSDEKKPSNKVLLPQGWRKFKIVGCEDTISKQNNKMFVITAEDKETGYEDTWYAVAEPKKRWFLKSILAACNCKASQDGVYDWDIPDVLNKDVECLVVHEDNEWINREGETIKTKQHKVSDVRGTEQETASAPTSEKEVEWDKEC